MTHAEETQGLPSASGMERIALCPGSFALEAQCPEPPESPEAASGTKIHAALAGDLIARDSLTDEERETYDACEGLAGQLMDQYGGTPHSMEKRLWSPSFPTYSGKYDRLIEFSDGWLAKDFKTGRGEVTPAESNWQLRALAVLVADNMPTDRYVVVAIIQPNGYPQVTQAVYYLEDIQTARVQISHILEQAYAPDAPRIPSIQACKYCRAKGICPEANAGVLDVAKREPLSLQTLNPQQLGEFMDACDRAEAVIEEGRRLAKERLKADPTSVAGYRLKPGAVKRSVKSVSGAFEALKGTLSRTEFESASSVSLGALATVYKEVTGCTQAAAEEAVAVVLREVKLIEEKQNQPSLERIKGGVK